MQEASPSPSVLQLFKSAPWTLIWLVLFTLVVRLPGINRPLVGNFATRNVVSAMVARNWIEGRADIWHPTLECLAGEHRMWILLEFPASTYATGLLWRCFGGSLDAWGRATAIGFMAASVGLVYLLVRRRHGSDAAVGAAFALAASPVSIIFGQSFMLEPSLVFFTLAAFYAQDCWLEGGRVVWLALAGGALSLAVLTKIYMLVLLLPLGMEAVGGWFRSTETTRPSSRRGPANLVVLAVAVLPAAGWYWHAARTAAPDGPFADRIFYSVRQSAGVHRPPHPLLAKPDFYRQVLDDLTGVVLTPVGFTIALAGLLHRSWRRYVPWLAAMAVLVAGLPLKFYEMNYYWVPVLPVLCVMAGLGWQRICRRLRPGRVAIVGLVLVLMLFSLRYAMKPAFITPPEDRAVVAAGRAIQEVAARGEPVVTMHGTTIDLLYYCNRPGWAVSPETPELERVLTDLRRQNARWLGYVPSGSTTPSALGRLPVRRSADGYTIYDLRGLDRAGGAGR
ncbi:MAG: glycosyltransferase family 39 protein [Pirellulales bacterium]|nr:glycosyltransferase family 39 protein [Pirellulales bacterium]